MCPLTPLSPIHAILNLLPPISISINTVFGLGCGYVDPNPLNKIDGQGHNYFRNENPYRLHSWAGFGEAYYQVAPDVKLTGGLRWTDDSKSFTAVPSQALLSGKGYPDGTVDSGIGNCRNGTELGESRAGSSATGRPSSISPIRPCSTHRIRAVTKAAAPTRPV